MVRRVEADLSERLEDLWVRRRAGRAARRAGGVPLAHLLPEQALGHHRAPLIPDADEQDVQGDLTPLTIAPCIPSATECVNSTETSRKPAASSPASYSDFESAPAMQPT